MYALYIYIYIYTYTHTYTYMYIYIYIYRPAPLPPGVVRLPERRRGGRRGLHVGRGELRGGNVMYHNMIHIYVYMM